ncbi:MAG: protein phosphatase 2C domain-containing protein [Nocardioidaceae bacterium]
MSQERLTSTYWVPAQASVRGSAHIRRNAPNEDATWTSRPGTIAAVAVADGHGDLACPRSGRGAIAAARIAVHVLMDTATRGFPADTDAILDLLRTRIVRLILEEWQEFVQNDAAAEPFTRREMSALLRLDMGDELDVADPSRLTDVKNYSEDLDALTTARAYGTTLVAALATQGLILVVQVGDGEAGVAFSDGTSLVPVPDDGPVGQATISLAMADAAGLARVAVLPTTSRETVSAVWVCSDGFSGAQADSTWRDLVAQQLLEQLAADGPQAVADKLSGWLAPAADTAGDDTSMAILLAGDPESEPSGNTDRLGPDNHTQIEDQSKSGLSTPRHSELRRRIVRLFGIEGGAGGSLGSD